MTITRNDNYVSDLRSFIVEQWRLAALGMSFDAPCQLSLWGGLATARRLAIDAQIDAQIGAQIDAQTAPVDMPLSALKLAGKLG